jgi:hypothetical protein
VSLTRNLFVDLMLGLVAVAAITLFHYFGGFTIPASLLLGVSFTIVGLWLYLLWKLAAFHELSTLGPLDMHGRNRRRLPCRHHLYAIAALEGPAKCTTSKR